MDHGTLQKRQRRDQDADVASAKRAPATPDEIRSASQSGDVAVLEDALKRTRNFLTVRASEGSVPPEDARVVLAKEWAERSPALTELFGLLERGVKPSTTSLALTVMAHQLNLLSSHFIYHSLGQPIIKKLVSHMWLHRLESYLSGSHNDLTLSALKLLLAMSRFAGSKEQKTLLEAFTWDAKVFHKLSFMQKHDKSSVSVQGAFDYLDRPDIRTLCLQFILSFISSPSSHVKSTMLEQHREIVQIVFKRIHTHPYTVVKFVLETLWTDLWQDRKVKRTLKIGLFNETTISLLLKLYDRDSEEDGDPEHIPANLVHHFLLAICTHRGIGICFPDNGWYPRPAEDDEPAEGETEEGRRKGRNKVLAFLLRSGGGGKIFNKILANVLKSLKVNEDARQQELALKILTACPELVAGYLSSAGITLEPRLSSKWLANVAFFGSVISLSVPVDSFLLPTSSASTLTTPQYNPTPPPLAIIIENILPSLNLKLHFSKGLQSASSLVQHTTALALVKCLNKFETVRDAFRKVALALGEGEDGYSTVGLWTRRWEEVEIEARKRVPDVQVIIAFSQQKHGAEERSVRASMLAEAAKRLLWLYHRCFPLLVAEVRFDVGRLLQDVVDAHSAPSFGEEASIRNQDAEGFDRLKQLHILRILEESDQLTWSGRAGSSSKSVFFVLVSIYLRSPHATIQSTLASVLTRSFSESLLFQHDPEEFKLWLDSLPKGVRAKDAKSLEGTPLADEGEGVLNFLDDCVQRCAKATHRFMEEMDALATSAWNENGEQTSGTTNASPLLMTVLEQLSAKVKAKLLGPSDQLAIVTYIRMLVASLIGKQPAGELSFFVAFVDRVVNVMEGAIASMREKDEGLAGACARESAFLKAIVTSCFEAGYEYKTLVENSVDASGDDVERFLRGVEKVQLPDSRRERKVAAYELIDWVRLVNPGLSRETTSRLSSIVARFHSPALRDLYFHVHPGLLGFWPWLEKETVKWANRLPLDHLLLLSTSLSLRSDHCRAVLLAAVNAQNFDVYSLKRYCGILMHRLAMQDDGARVILLGILTDIVDIVLPSLEAGAKRAFKTFMFNESPVFKTLLCEANMPLASSTLLSRLVNCLADPRVDGDRELLASACSFWASTIQTNIEKGAFDEVSLRNAIAWIKYMPQTDVTHLLAELITCVRSWIGSSIGSDSLTVLRPLIEELLVALSTIGSLDWLQKHLYGLVLLRKHIIDMPRLDDTIAVSVNASLPLGIDSSFVSEDQPPFAAILEQAESKWLLRLSRLPDEIQVQPFLNSTPWSKSTSAIITGMIYRSASARQAYQQWLWTDGAATSIPTALLVPSFHAFLETASETKFESHEKLYRRLWSKFVLALLKQSQERQVQQRLRTCMVSFFKQAASLQSSYAEDFCAKLSKTPFDSIIPEALDLASALAQQSESKGKKLCQAVINHALQWAVRFLSGTSNLGSHEKRAIAELCNLVHLTKQLPPSFAEPVIVAAIQDQESLDVDVVRLLDALFLSTSLKPVSVNRHLQNLLQHRHVQRLTATQDSSNGLHDALAKLLHTIFHTHPTNTCQPSHLPPLIQIYGGTLSSADLHILGVFRLYEAQRRISVASLIGNWSAPGNSTSQSCLDAISYLDPGQVLRTFMNFPTQRSLDDVGEFKVRPCDGQIYDPVFVMLLFAQVVSSCPPSSALGWVQLFRTNVVSLIIRCLSSRDSGLRRLARVQVGALYKLIEVADMHEKPHVMHLLGLLRDAAKTPTDESALRLPSYITLLLAHSLRGVFYPQNFMYPLTARFLLQRPELDIYDVPMLYSLLYSHDDNWKKERGWILKFLADGLLSSTDWRVFKRRHTWELLASLFQSSHDDRPLRHGILQVLASLTCIEQAVTSLILRSSLIAWMDIQTQTANGDEHLAWVRIVENISMVVNPEKVEKSTRGEWRSGLLRCLVALLRSSSSSVLHVAARTTYRLLACCSNDRFMDKGSMGVETITASLNCLQTWEQQANGPMYAPDSYEALNIARQRALHDCHGLFQDSDDDKTIVWGEVVESLWKASMFCSMSRNTWDKLSCRMLVWRSLSDSDTVEWVRREVVMLISASA